LDLARLRADGAVMRHETAAVLAVEDASRDVADAAEARRLLSGIERAHGDGGAARGAHGLVHALHDLARREAHALVKRLAGCPRGLARLRAVPEPIAHHEGAPPVILGHRPAVAAYGLAGERHRKAADRAQGGRPSGAARPHGHE